MTVRALVARSTTVPALAVAAGLFAAAGARASEGPSEGPADERHYVTTYHGEVIGVQRVRVTEAEHEGRPAVRKRFREEQRIRARGVTQRTLTERTELTDADGLAIRLTERRTEAGQVVDMRIDVTDESVVFRTRVAGREKAFRAPRPASGDGNADIRFDIDGEAFARKGTLRPGATLRGLVVARVELGIAELVAKVVEGVRLPEVEGVYPPGSRGFRIAVSNAKGAGEPWELLVDDGGTTVELRIGPMVVRRCTPEEARLPRKAALLANRFPTAPVAKPERARSMKVEATVASDCREDVFPESIYGSAEREGLAAGEARDGGAGPGERAEGGIRYVLSLTEARPDGRLPRAELPDEDRARFLQASQLVESDAPEVKALAREALRGEKEPLKQALLLTRWVYRNLRKRSAGPATASALEALRAGSGDCTEHAALLAALARASGLPARQAMGLVHDGDAFEFHAWTEVFVEDRSAAAPGGAGASKVAGVTGRWVPLDPTLGRAGVPAAYILLGREGDIVEYHSRANALQGRTTMRIVEID